MATKVVTCDDTAWTNLAILGATSALIQLDKNGPVKLYMGDAAPGVGDTVGIVLERGTGLPEVAFNNIPAGQDFWIRAMDRDPERVTVMFA